MTVAVKATFAFPDGEPALANEQEPLRPDRYWNGDSSASLWSAGDLVPFKPQVDVTLVGHVYAPLRSAPLQLVARLTVGELAKSVQVNGDRRWQKGAGGGLATAQQPITAVPLRYERGPRGDLNPIGFDLDQTFADDPVHEPLAMKTVELTEIERDTTLRLGAVAAPNLEPEEGASPCFGPVPLAWRLARSRISPRARAWAERFSATTWDRPLLVIDEPAPPDFDFGIFNAAPRELQVSGLAPGAAIVLEHMHRRLAPIRTRVPELAPRVMRGATPLRLRLDTLWIDADRERLVLLWRAVVQVQDPAVEHLIVESGAGSTARAPWPESPSEADEHTLTLPGSGSRTEDSLDLTQEVDARSVRIPALPFEAPASVRFHVAPAVPLAVTRGPLAVAPTPPSSAPIINGPPSSAPVSPAPAAAAPIMLLGATKLRTASTPAIDDAEERRFPITRYAVVVAAVEADPSRRADVLRAQHLTPSAFARLERRFAHALAEEKVRGVDELQRAYAAAYQAAKERPADEITVSDYAFVVVSIERGEIDRVLAALGIRLADLMRIQQAWRRRMVLDPELFAEVDRAITAERRTRA